MSLFQLLAFVPQLLIYPLRERLDWRSVYITVGQPDRPECYRNYVRGTNLSCVRPPLIIERRSPILNCAGAAGPSDLGCIQYR